MKRVLTIVTGILILLSLFLAACAPKIPPAPSPQASAAQAPLPAAAKPAASAIPARPAWEEKWETVLEAAKKEGTVLVWSTASQWRAPITEAINRKYGIKAELIITGRTAEAYPKLFAERRAGLYTVDVFLTGVVSPVIELKPERVLDPLDAALILPEVVDPKLWFHEKLPFVDRDHTVIAFFSLAQPTLTINTNLVKPEDIQSYNDLLNPKWKGKIMVNDPTTSGAGAYIGFLAEKLMGGWDYLRNLAKNEPVVMRDKRIQLDWLAHGKVAFSVMTPTDPLTEFIKAGAPIRVVHPKEGTFTSAGAGGVFRINKAPHHNAGTLFINWLLSKEGQTTVGKAMGYPSAREDVPTDFVNPVFVRSPNVKYFESATEEYAFKQPEDIKIQKEIFGALLK